MQFRSALNRLLYTVVPGLGQLLNGQYIAGTLMAVAAVSTIYLAESSNTEYRRLQTEYKKLNLPNAFHAAVAGDRAKSLLMLTGLYLGMGVISASLYREDPHDEQHDDEPPEAEEP